jgi:eukaryotic-like serine/threonine-protein kinase
VPPERFGKYRVLRRIASGGMSEVYLCVLPGEGGFRKRVALKVVHPRHAGDPRFRTLFIREARLAASLSHPNIIQVFDFGRDGEAFFLAMEYVEGWDLAQAAAQARQSGVSIPPGVWRHWVDGIWSGLGHLHDRGIVHRDVSPANILLGRTGAVKLTDFGVSRAAAGSDRTGDALAGKSGYLAPERARGEAATCASDLFAAGVVSAELLLGRRVFEGSGEDVLARVRRFDGRRLELPGAPDGVVAAIRAVLSADATERPRSAGDFLAALGADAPPRAQPRELAAFWDVLFPGEEQETAPPFEAEGDSGPSMVKEPARRYGLPRRTVQAGAAAAIAALAAGGAMLWIETHPPDRVPAPTATPASRGDAAPSLPGVPYGTRVPRRAAASPERAHATTAGGGGSKATRTGDASNLARRAVRIETEPEGASIVLGDGTSGGATPAELDLSLIGGGIALVREGYVRSAVPASALAAGGTFRMRLEPVLGTVEAIQALPWATVYVDGRLLGETPLTKVRLPVGSHRVRLVNDPLGVDTTMALSVRPGSNPKIIVPLTDGAAR